MSRISTLVARRTTAFMMALHLLVVIACAQTRKPAAEQNGKNPSNSSPAHFEIKPDSLPPPNATRSAVNPPRVVPMPEGATLALPPGFEVAVYAEGNLEEPRWLALAPNGDVFVAESRAGRITILRDANKDGTIDERLVFATGLTQPFGMAFWRDYFYVANTDSVVRFKYKPGQAKAEGNPEKITDHATFEKPHQYATGVIHVFVNGVQVLRDGEHTGAKPGEVVRGPGWTGWGQQARGNCIALIRGCSHRNR